MNRPEAHAPRLTNQFELVIDDDRGRQSRHSIRCHLEQARNVLGANKVSGVILRVANVTVTDSSGLGELTVLYTMATNRKCPIRLVEVTPSLKKMLEMTRIDELLPALNSVSSAKAELRSKAAGA